MTAPLHRWLRGDAGLALVCAGILIAVAFVAGGGLYLGSMTAVEIALTLGSGLVVAGVVWASSRRSGEARDGVSTGATARPVHGLWPVALMFGFAALSAVSVAWSVEPNGSWQDAGRLFAYAGVFATAVALVRVAPRRWAAVLGGVTLAAVAISTYALLTRVFPAQLDPNETYARLQQPYGYWIATGLTAAMGAIGCLWLGARRDGHGALRALAFPAMGIELTTLMLTYSRGPLAALTIGLAFWLTAVPLRLRSTAVLLVGGAGAAVPVAFAFSSHALSSSDVALASRVSAGHQLGILLAATLLAVTVAGGAICFFAARRAPRPKLRRLAAGVLLGGLLACVLAVLGGLAASQRGLTGTISHDVSALTNPNAKTPENAPSRLTAIASVRARYWKEALEIFSAHRAVGAGAGTYATARLRYRTEALNVRQAHGYIVQTLADLGLVGLLVTLCLLGAWLVAAGRATHPWGRRWQQWRWRAHDAPYTPERIALLSALGIVIVFGAHSLIDWTWYVPGDACPALLCAGWLAGRGPLEPAAQAAAKPTNALVGRLGELGRLRVAAVCAIAALAVLTAWIQWQPERSAQAAERALATASANPRQALADVQSAVADDPVSLQALQTLAAIQERNGEAAQAEATLRKAVRTQPANPQAWAALGEHDLLAGSDAAAVDELRAAVYLNPEIVAPESSITFSPELLTVRNDYLQALRATGT